VLYGFGILLSPAFGAVLMAASTVVVAINARFLRVKGNHRIGLDNIYERI
jgi:Cu2+-exporting ATPase